MERGEQSNPCNCCWTLVVMIGISTMLIKWDIDTIHDWNSLEPFSYSVLWNLGMSLTLTVAWFSLPILVTLLICRADKLAKFVGVMLLFCCGPNLFIWNIIGCSIGAFEFKDFCVAKDNCSLDPMVIAMKIFVWGVLFVISFICDWGLFSILISVCKSLRLKSKMKRWRQVKSKGEILIESTCSICLDNFVKGEKIRELDCKHEFHPDCIDLWMQDHLTCPICRKLCDA
jgi:Ring finger domain